MSADISAYERLTGVGEAVHNVAEKHEELHQQCVDSQYLVADASRFGGDESEHRRQAYRAEEDVAIHLEELFHGAPLQRLADKIACQMASEEFPIAEYEEEEPDGQTAVLGNDGA